MKETCPEPIRVGKKPASITKDDDCTTKWEYYSALPVATSRDARIRPEKNINERGCRWGTEICQSCMECVSNIEENGEYPSPEIDFWDQDEEQIRNNAVMPVV